MINIASENWKNAASEMRLVANLNRTEKCVYHHWLSFSPDEKLSDDAMFKAASLMIEKLGLSDHQHVMAIHRDRDHAHVHIVSNLVSFDGKAQKLSHDYNSRPVFAREIEAELCLKKFERSPRTPNASARSFEIFSSEKITHIQKILSFSRSFEDLKGSLENIGLHISEKSSRSNSLNYRITDIESGLYISGSKIDDALSSPTKLKKHFRSDDDKPMQKDKDIDISLSLRIRECLDKSDSWSNAEIRLKEIGISIDYIKSGDRIRGIRFVNSENNINIKASDIGISYAKFDKQFKDVKSVSETSHQGKIEMLNPSHNQSVSSSIPNSQLMQSQMQMPMMQIPSIMSPLDFSSLRQQWMADAESSIRQTLGFKEYQLQQQNMMNSLNENHQRKMLELKQKHKSWFMPSLATMLSLKLGIPALTTRSGDEIDNINLMNKCINDMRTNENNYINDMISKNYCSLNEYAVRKMMGIQHDHHLNNDIARAEMMRSSTKSLKCELNGNLINILTINNKIIGYSINGNDAIPIGNDDKNIYAVNCYNELNNVDNNVMKEIYERHNSVDARVLTPESLQEMQNIFSLNSGAVTAIRAAASTPREKPDPIKSALIGSMPSYRPKIISEKIVNAAAEIIAKRAAEQPAAPVRSSGRDR
ncbi:MAG: relaxase/mobilization nuclease domain-containing protein [Elstera cyanobacteriorum]|nr:relaxase/mobilization nuclease domain-containing protein [Elstera cyanobacteriorum]